MVASVLKGSLIFEALRVYLRRNQTKTNNNITKKQKSNNNVEEAS